jgi:hypothetical protein
MTARFTRKTRETKWVSFYTYQVSFDLSMTSRCTRRTGERGKTGRDREGLQRERERDCSGRYCLEGLKKNVC